MIEKLPIRRADIHPLDRAIAELRAELTRSPDDPTLLGRLGALFYRRGDLADAEKYYRQAISLSPNRPSLYNNLGNVFCDMGRMRDGIGAYEHAMAIEKSLYPNREPSAEAIINLELARTEFRLIHERIEYLERATQLEVSSDETHNALGCAYLLRGDGEKALRVFRKAAEMNPRNRFAGLNIAFTHTLNLEGPLNLKAALAEVSEAIMRFPREARLQIHYGELQESAGLLEDAAQRYLRATQADPRCLEAYDLLGRLREATGLTQTQDEAARSVGETLQRLEKAAQERRAREGNAAGAVPIYDLACVAVARARFERTPVASHKVVDALLREAVAASKATTAEFDADVGDIPDVAARATILRAQLLHADGRNDEARAILENASAAEPGQARLWFERGSLALRSGDIATALQCYEHTMLCAPQDALPCHSLRFAFEGYRRYRTESVRFETATRANPRDGLAHHHLALAALSVLKDEEALLHFTRALELDPRLSDAACGRGRALQHLGHLAEAEASYEKALAIDSENTEAHRSLMTIRSQKQLNPIGASFHKSR
ncbi:MAG: tetratricopeptide repeat protein [Planctomycetota bacterium]